MPALAVDVARRFMLKVIVQMLYRLQCYKAEFDFDKAIDCLQEVTVILENLAVL